MYTPDMRAIKLEPGTFDIVRTQLRATAQGRRWHRMHAILLVAGGLSCRQAARLLGASPRSVEYWVRRYIDNKYNISKDKKHTGRRPRLTIEQLAQLRVVLDGSSLETSAPAHGWDGPSVRAYLARRWGVELGLRRVQALMVSFRR